MASWNLEALLFLFACFFVVVVASVLLHWRRVRREQRAMDRMEALRQAGVSVPPSLHPVIDSNLCISSGNCTLVCPQGNNVIGLIENRGTLVDPSACIGHGRCAAECPVGAIRLVFGTSERGVDIPHVKPTFETNVAGLYVAGELGGMGLIVNAVRQAKSAMHNLAQSLKGEGGDDSAEQVAIVGAGPAGLTAALASIEMGLSYRLFEREPAIGGSVMHYPRRKLVMTSPVEMPLLGHVYSRTMSKEELLALWDKATRKHAVKIEYGVSVTDVRKENGVFVLDTSAGPVRTRRVLLTIGRRGEPRKLGVPGEEREKVVYLLRDPGMYAGKRVLVVGGGDSAIEAAAMIAEETDAEVALSYRGPAISRTKPENRERIGRLIEQGRVAAIFDSQVTAIEEKSVILAVPGGQRTIANDDVLVFAGGSPPSEFLRRAGVRMERHYGEETEHHRTAEKEHIFEHIREQRRSKGLADARASIRRVFAVPAALGALGVLGLTALFVLGRAYYFGLPGKPWVELFKPTGIIGHSLGVAALAFMAINFSYFARKEFKPLRGVGDIRAWMATHVVSGILALCILLVHSSLYLKNIFALTLYLSFGLVVFTGLLGRYLYAFVPLDPLGRPLTRQALRSLSERMLLENAPLLARLPISPKLRPLLAEPQITEHRWPELVYRLLVWWPLRWFELRRLLSQINGNLGDEETVETFRHYTREIVQLHFQQEFLPKLKRLLGVWRSVHAVLAFLLFFLVLAHTAIEWWLGYRWVF
ncbi:MAG: 4Fe-4S dicluster domain-containing protein [Myxococcales bacterium]|nr:MAG: 4Fe-4S dicluster domain-containing protein [Myxococcales bacterium]